MAGVELNGITVCVRVRPLNQRELNEGNRVCVHFDEDTKQVALTAVDRNTLMQLKGQTARGYAFDKRYGMDDSSDAIFSDCVESVVDNVFKGYNGTVLAYGQTGSGKTHTMSGGIGHYGVKEPGITPRVIEHLFNHLDTIRRRLKPGESVGISASAVEIYNEELRDLSKTPRAAAAQNGWDASKAAKAELKLQEIPTGQGNRVRAEVGGLTEHQCESREDLRHFFDLCFANRSTSSTKLNDTSSRSHAIFTINVHRVIVTVGDGVDANLKARIRTEGVESKLHLVDLAGSERVKRSGVAGKEFKEATHINQGLLALGNVIVALAENHAHIPYRSSKLTRLIQDALGGNSLTVLITCISPSEADFEETNNTLKYANRACAIKNVPLPNKFLMLEEDLLPPAPGEGGAGAAGSMISLEALLADNIRQRELRERRARERQEKERLQREAFSMKKEQLMKKKGYQRLLAQAYDQKLKEARMRGRKNFAINESVDGNALRGSRDLAAATGANGSFNFSDFVKRSRQGGALEADGTPRTDTSVSATPAGTPAASPEQPTPSPKLPSALARALARKAQASPGGTVPAATLTHSAAAASVRSEASTVTTDAHMADDTDTEEPLAEEIQRQVREEAEREALKRAAEEEGVSLDEDEDGSDGAGAGDVGEEVTSRGDAGGGNGGDACAVDEEGAGEDAGEGAGRVLARFRVNKRDVVSVFKATTKEDFKDVVKLLPENTPLPASNKMTYLISRLELEPGVSLAARLARVASGEATMSDALGPAVGCLMATFGTNMISSCIFDFEDPEDLEEFAVEERIELWGLQIPHNSLRPVLRDVNPEELEGGAETEQTVQWSSVDRLNMSVGLLYALCVNAESANVRCGFCVPRQQLLKRWQGAGVLMKEVSTAMRLIYPPHAHDFEYYKSSTVAYFLVDEVQDGLQHKLALAEDEV